MAWFKVDDGWWSHPKTLTLSNDAVALWTRSGSWSCQHLTDGFIPKEAIKTLGGTAKVAAELVKVEYWEAIPGGWIFHDWDEYQEASEVVKKRRNDARERMRVVRANRTRTDSDGSHEVRSTPTRPDPTRPTTRLNEVRPVPEIGRQTGPDEIDLRKVKSAVQKFCGRRVSDPMANMIVGDLLLKATSPVRDNTAYVLKAIEGSKFEVQQLIDESEVA